MPSKTKPAPPAPTPRTDVEDMYPLSPMQQGMLYETLYAPDSGIYMTQMVTALEGEIDIALLQQCWRTVLDRHPVLRTFFVWGDLKTWAQVVKRDVELPFELVDLRHLDDDEQDLRIEARRSEDRQKSLDLARPPLMRLVAFRQRDDLYLSVWTFHHILLDAWSVSIVLRELFELYAAGQASREPHLIPQPPLYRNYLVWIQRQDRAAAEAFWRSELAGFEAPTLLPFGEARAQKAQPGPQVSVYRRLSEQTTTNVTAAAKRCRVTLNTLMQGCWGYLLSRYTGERDVIFGTGVSGRPAELEGADRMVGLFVNTIPVRVSCDPSTEVASWLQGLQRRQLAARAFEYVPLVDLQSWSEIAPGLPLFEVGLNFENFPTVNAPAANAPAANGDAQNPPAATAAPVQLRQVAGYDQTDVPWTLGARPGRQLSLRIDYLTERFDAATAERALGHLESILEAFAAGTRHVGELPLLCAEERRQILTEWQPEDELPTEAVFVHRDFEAVAGQFPDRVALLSGSTTLTYGELDARANQLARGLRRLGAGPETRVGVYLERHLPECMIALFAILKTGGAYVALDPAYPTHRLEQMVGAANLPWILSRQELADEVPGDSRVICPDRDWTTFETETSTPLAEDPPASAQVYVVFTSGSSGQPKGVVAEHGSLGLRIHSLREMYDFGPGDKLLQFCALSFDASIEEIFPTLTAGATLIQHPAASELTPAELLDEVQRLAIDSLHLPPVYWHEVVNYLEAKDLPVPPQVRRYITGGEAPSPQKIAIWARRAESPRRTQPTRMWNGYGPTEATFGCSTHEPRLDAQELASLGRLPIGRPWPHNRLTIRAADLALLPAGVAGEICCGSPILTRGYLDRPGLTADKFVPDPETPQPGARMYLTGDVGRFLANGQLDFLGRNDSQVKVRGMRIELKDVEAALAAHPKLAAAAVALHGEDSERQLVGYFTLREGQPPSDDALRHHLQSRLPLPMVPSLFVVLDELPISPNGKVDRKSLPTPGPVATRKHVAPETETERLLVQIWQKILNRERVSVVDDFFSLGGHSLLAVRLMAQLDKQFDRQIPLAALFEARTIRRLAVLIDDPQADLPWQPLVALRDDGSGLPLYCIHPVGGEVLCFQPLADRLQSEHPVYGLQAPGLGETQDSPSIEALAEGYLAEIRKVQPEGPYHLLGWSFGSFVAYEMACRIRSAGGDVGGVYLLDTWAPLFESPPEDEDLQMLVDLARNRARQAGRPIPVMPLEELAQLGDEARLERYLELLKDNDLIPDEVGIPMARNILRGYRVRRRIVEAYRPGPYEGEVTLFVTGETEDADYLATLERVGLDIKDPTLGWSRLASRPVEVLTVGGSHETLCAEPHVATLATQLRNLLERRSSPVDALI